MAKIWVLSDLHYELMWPNIDGDLPRVKAADLLIMAGDCHNAFKLMPFLARKFPALPVVAVAGNHEHYETGASVQRGIQWMRTAARDVRETQTGEVYFLENETVVLDLAGEKIRVIGSTLWTDFKLFENNVGHMAYCQMGMNDFVYIESDAEPGHKLRPIETVQWHQAARAFIAAELAKPFDGKTIVVTHHGPSIRSVAQRYLKDPLSAAFAANCDDLLAMGADLWCHGHTHDSFDYMAGSTRVICNPRGYSARPGGGRPENKMFDPSLLVEV